MLSDEIFEFDVIALAKQLHESEETSKDSSLKFFLLNLISLFFEIAESLQSVCFMIIVVIAINRLDDKLVITRDQCSRYFIYFGWYFLAEFTDNFLNFAEKFIFLVFFHLAQKWVLADVVSA